MGAELLTAVERNEQWRGAQCINLLAPEAPTSQYRPAASLVHRHEIIGEWGGSLFFNGAHQAPLRRLRKAVMKKSGYEPTPVGGMGAP